MRFFRGNLVPRLIRTLTAVLILSGLSIPTAVAAVAPICGSRICVNGTFGTFPDTTIGDTSTIELSFNFAGVSRYAGYIVDFTYFGLDSSAQNSGISVDEALSSCYTLTSVPLSNESCTVTFNWSPTQIGSPTFPSTGSLNMQGRLEDGDGMLIDLAIIPSQPFRFYGTAIAPPAPPTILIHDQAELEAVTQNQIDFPGASYVLANSFEVTTPNGGYAYIMGNFVGNFDGGSYTISGLTAPLFESIGSEYGESGNISHLYLHTGESGTESYGILAPDFKDGTVSDVHVEGTLNVSIDKASGGLVGSTSSSTLIELSSAAISIFVANTFIARRDIEVGGLVGRAMGTIDRCASSGDILYTSVAGDAERSIDIGGLVGLASTMGTVIISNSGSTVNITTYEFPGFPMSTVGGLVGRAEGTEMSRSLATGDIVSAAQSNGGLVGITRTSVITSSIAAGNVSSSETNTGDLFGQFIEFSTNDNSSAETVAYLKLSGVEHLNDGLNIWAIDPTINNGIPYIIALDPSGFYVHAPLPEPPTTTYVTERLQQSKIFSLTPDNGVDGIATTVEIIGIFIEKITEIQINGGPNLPIGSWTQTLNLISLTIPGRSLGSFSLVFTNGSAPALIAPLFYVKPNFPEQSVSPVAPLVVVETEILPAPSKKDPVAKFSTLSKLYFEMGSAELSIVEQKKITKLATRLAAYGKSLNINVNGFAQPTKNTEKIDGPLSTRRAAEVARLLKKAGINAKIEYFGLGRTKVNSSSSRRAEIVVSNK